MADLEQAGLEDLETMMADMTDVQKVTPDEAPEALPPADEPAPVAPKEPEPAAAPPEPEATPAEVQVEPKIEVEEDAVRAARQADDDRREAVMEKLMAHNSRLASQIGELKKSISRTPPAEMGEVSDERVSELQRQIDQMQEHQRAEARGRAITEEVRAARERPYLKDIDPAILAAVTQKHEASWNEAVSEEDPDLARLSARTVLLTVAAEARRSQLEKAQVEARERRAEQTKKLTDAKLKASVSASGAAPPQKTPEKTLAERSVKELEALLDQMTG